MNTKRIIQCENRVLYNDNAVKRVIKYGNVHSVSRQKIQKEGPCAR
jgi:hypothetical protein